MRTTTRLCALSLVLLAACGGSVPAGPTPGIVTVTFSARSPADPKLVLTTGDMHLSHLVVSGDAPPTVGLRSPELPVVLIHDGAVSTSLLGLEPGVYDLVQVDYGGVRMSGTWRGVPLTLHVEPVGPPQVSTRAAVGHELGQGEDATFGVTIDVGSWFAGDLLDAAMTRDGTLTCDDVENPTVTTQLAERISRSFSTD